MTCEFIIIPIACAGLAQFVFKPMVSVLRNDFSWTSMLRYGGMPSAHSSLVSSLSTLMYLHFGANSAEFAISLFFAILVMIDAIGLRSYITTQGKTINQIIKDLPDELEYKYNVMNEKVAHTIPQVLLGIMLSILMTILLDCLL